MNCRHIVAHRCNGFMQGCKNPLFADGRRDPVPVHVGAKVPVDTGEDDADTLMRQFIEQIAHRLRGGVVDIRDRAASTINQRTGVGARSTSKRTSSAKRPALA